MRGLSAALVQGMLLAPHETPGVCWGGAPRSKGNSGELRQGEAGFSFSTGEPPFLALDSLDWHGKSESCKEKVTFRKLWGRRGSGWDIAASVLGRTLTVCSPELQKKGEYSG